MGTVAESGIVIERRVTIRCDGYKRPGCIKREFTDGLLSSVARAELAAQGWTSRGQKDFCPECSARDAEGS